MMACGDWVFVACFCNQVKLYFYHHSHQGSGSAIYRFSQHALVYDLTSVALVLLLNLTMLWSMHRRDNDDGDTIIMSDSDWLAGAVTYTALVQYLGYLYILTASLNLIAVTSSECLKMAAFGFYEEEEAGDKPASVLQSPWRMRSPFERCLFSAP